MDSSPTKNLSSFTHSFVYNVLQNIFFYVQQKKLIHAGLEQLEDE